MKYFLSDIASIISAEGDVDPAVCIEQLLLDSRKVQSATHSLFFAIKGARRDGHQFLPELYKKGIRNFVVSEEIDNTLYPGAHFLLVDDTLVALQQLAAHHRSRFDIPVVGITGSNGKTIVKEWLYQLLHKDVHVVRSPKSYNSQIGVPLSIWQMNEEQELALFEAGISEQGEMLRLERMIQPTMGILTNIGDAHSEGFVDADHKFREKMVLFRNCKKLIGRAVDFEGRKEVIEMFGEELQVFTWGMDDGCEFIVRSVSKQDQSTTISISREGADCIVTIPFTDDASVENAISCVCFLLEWGMSPAIIAERMSELHAVNMRLELKKGINHCSIINDSYSADPDSLEIALNFLNQQRGNTRKTVILSDFLQSATEDSELYDYIFETVKKHGVTRLIGIGERISVHLQDHAASVNAEPTVELFSSTAEFVQQFRSSQFREENILVKGARAFAFEEIVQLLELKAHQTVLEINLNAIVHNLKVYQQLLKPSTKIMAMVKAFAYGSGGAEIAGILQYHKVDYLGVAYADEGVELRKAGITLPIMVMNAEAAAFESIVEYQLEPDLYSFELLQAFEKYLQQEGVEQYPVHIEIETGMNRLGFAVQDIEKLANALNEGAWFRVQSVFSHLAASEEAAQDDFTKQQFALFDKASKELQERTGSSFIRHIANSAAAIRHSELHLDMIRLGIGMYGVDSSGTGQLDLHPVATLKSTIAQIRKLKAGDSVSYNRKGKVERDSVIATVRIGYADGYPRRLGNGIGKVKINNQSAPLIGTVCMDMFMVDITGLTGVQEGDEVIIFGKELPIQELAQWAGTIPYEIMTGISQRVKRIYFEE